MKQKKNIENKLHAMLSAGRYRSTDIGYEIIYSQI